MTAFLIIWYAVFNIAAFLAYGIDKLKAARNWWRIPEKWLLGLAAAGGALGAILGSDLFHHKTSRGKIYFRIVNYLSLALHVSLLAYLFFGHSFQESLP